ncbi:MAG: hypothetical protein Q7S02_06195 [bacterium]|nr:hypothetical protein [bacterium]
MLKIKEAHGVFEVPRIVFTIRGNPRSEAVIAFMAGPECADKRTGTQEYTVFDDVSALRARFESGVSPAAAVVLFDATATRSFSMHTHSRVMDSGVFPAWSLGAQWGVRVSAHRADRPSTIRSCALQVLANFDRRFDLRIENGEFPWGKPRKGESPPKHVTMPETIGDTIARLNAGPNLAAAIANTEHALELPPDSRISWARVVPEPVECDEPYLTKVVTALQTFEVACTQLLRERPEVRDDVFAGVTFADDPRIRDLYCDPPTERFSVDRPDLHWTGNGVFASEVDEMPGGFPELVHIDQAYDVNQDRWRRCFDWLLREGPLLFLVSHEWSKCYVTETTWLVAYLQGLGYPVMLRTTDQLQDVEVSIGGVTVAGTRIGTIWRQFPIFETQGKLVDIVAAARAGVVRLVPEFAHWGNKVWFSLFRKHTSFFHRVLPSETYAMLDAVLPDSYLVRSAASFPGRADGVAFHNLEALRGLTEDVRDRVVLKVCGANVLAARSYGVLMGKGLSDDTWRRWIDERLTLQQPFIVQRRLETGIARLPVQHTGRGCPELFSCRVLLRPWIVGDEIVSAHGCAVPSNTLRVHGRVDMAILPVRFASA